MDPMLDESQFHVLADATLTHCFEQLEPFFDSGALEDLDLQGGILTILTEAGKTFLLTKHSPTRQVWLASPVSGGLHFVYSGKDWRLPDNTELYDHLQRELAAEQITVVL